MKSAIIRNIIVIVTICLLNDPAHAQLSKSEADSLLQIWNDPQRPTKIRLQCMDKLFDPQNFFFNYNFEDFDTIRYYANQQIQLAKESGQAYYQVKAMDVKASLLAFERKDPGMIWSIIEEEEQVAIRADDSLAYLIVLESKSGYYSNVEEDESKSYKYLIEAIGLAGRLGERALEARMNESMAWMIGNIGNHDRSVPYFKRALNYYVETKKMKEAGSVALNIGRAFYFLQEYDSAKVYLFQALDAFKQSQDTLKHVLSVMQRLSFVYEKEGDYEKLESICKRGLKLSRGKAESHIMNWHFNLAKAYHYLNKNSLALTHLDTAIVLNETNPNKINQIFNITRFGNLYLDLGDDQSALQQCKKAYTMAMNVNSLGHIKNACNCLHKVYRSLGNPEKALEYQDLAKAYEDTLKIEERAKEIQRLDFEQMIIETNAENERRSKLMEETYEAEVRQKRKDRNVAWGIGILATLTALGFYIRWLYVRRSRDAISKERERSENLLHNILPAEVAAELKAKGQAEARDYEMVSILFTDFIRFTETSEQLSTSELVAEINTCFQEFDRILEKYKIEKIKTIGDAYMAAGGLPVPTKDSVRNTVLAALELQEFITERKKELDAEGKTGFEMRVGVHTGPVVAGIVGVKKFQYDIWGDTVNTANRMESHGEAGKVNISGNTYEKIKDDPDLKFEPRGNIEAKGKGKMKMYFVSKK